MNRIKFILSSLLFLAWGMAAGAQGLVSVEDFTIGAGEQKAVSFNLAAAATGRYTGVSFDVTLPEGLSFVEGEVGENVADHVITAVPKADGTVGVMLYSPSSSVLADEGEIITLTVEAAADVPAKGEIQVSAVRATDAAAVAYPFDDFKVNVTFEGAPAAAGLLSVEDFTIGRGEQKTVSFCLMADATGKYTGVNFYVTLPEGLAFVKGEVGENVGDHVIDASLTDDGSRVLVVLYSLSSTVLADEGEIITLTVEAAAEGAEGGEILVSGVRSTNAAAVTTVFEDFRVNVTFEEAAPVEKATIDFAAQGYENAQVVETATAADGSAAATLSKGTGSSAPAYYESNKAVRLYGGNTLTVSSDKKIEKMVFDYELNKHAATDLAASEGTLSGTTWEGLAKEVTFTNTNTASGHFRMKTITIFYAPVDAAEVVNDSLYGVATALVDTLKADLAAVTDSIKAFADTTVVAAMADGLEAIAADIDTLSQGVAAAYADVTLAAQMDSIEAVAAAIETEIAAAVATAAELQAAYEAKQAQIAANEAAMAELQAILAENQEAIDAAAQTVDGYAQEVKDAMAEQTEALNQEVAALATKVAENYAALTLPEKMDEIKADIETVKNDFVSYLAAAAAAQAAYEAEQAEQAKIAANEAAKAEADEQVNTVKAELEAVKEAIAGYAAEVAAAQEEGVAAVAQNVAALEEAVAQAYDEVTLAEKLDEVKAQAEAVKSEIAALAEAAAKAQAEYEASQQPEIYEFSDTELTKDLFKSWSGVGPVATVVSNNPYWDAAEYGTEVESGGVVYGSSNVTNTDYANITGAEVMRIFGEPGASLRVIFNREEDTSIWYELRPTIGDDGYVDVDFSIYKYVHLNAIKVNWGSTAKVTSIVLNPTTDPVATDIQSLSSLDGMEIEAVYSMAGAPLLGLQKGINIVRYTNGVVKKILVK
ncbi:MAG: hypothetical protein IJV06_05245 [Bacteroidaceae bacterium]|nr:hypothetical protein [Bacteroidaceae bacterium]